MAIGSEPEYGTRFSTIHNFDWAAWKRMVGSDLMGGYARVVYVDPERVREINVVQGSAVQGPFQEAG